MPEVVDDLESAVNHTDFSVSGEELPGHLDSARVRHVVRIQEQDVGVTRFERFRYPHVARVPRAAIRRGIDHLQATFELGRAAREVLSHVRRRGVVVHQNRSPIVVSLSAEAFESAIQIVELLLGSSAEMRQDEGCDSVGLLMLEGLACFERLSDMLHDSRPPRRSTRR
jgi:hypothetical protein